MTNALVLLLGLGFGAVGVWLALRPALVERRRLSDQLADVRADLAASEARGHALEEKLPEALRAISADTLASSRDAFLQQAGERVEKTLLPVHQRLGDLRKLVDDTEARRLEDGGRLAEQLDVLTSGTQTLAVALGSAQRRGRWGEVQLERILELAGLREGLDYSRQAARDGVRPDVVVHLPGGKNVVIDAKAPFDAFERAAQASSEEERSAAAGEFARKVRAHVTELGGKTYWAHVSPSPDFTFMFLPGDAYLATAEQHDPDLFDFAHQRGVYLATPRTVLVLLRTIRVAWQNENAAESAQQVLDAAAEIHDRLATFAEHLAKVGRGLDSAVKAYNSGVSSFDSRVAVSARRLEELAQTRREITDLRPVTELAAAPVGLGERLGALQAAPPAPAQLEVVGPGADAA